MNAHRISHNYHNLAKQPGKRTNQRLTPALKAGVSRWFVRLPYG